MAWIKQVLVKLCHADLRDFMSQCGKQKRFSYSSENSAVVAFGMGGFCRSVLPPGSCPHESSQTQESWGRREERRGEER